MEFSDESITGVPWDSVDFSRCTYLGLDTPSRALHGSASACLFMLFFLPLIFPSTDMDWILVMCQALSRPLQVIPFSGRIECGWERGERWSWSWIVDSIVSRPEEFGLCPEERGEPIPSLFFKLQFSVSHMHQTSTFHAWDHAIPTTWMPTLPTLPLFSYYTDFLSHWSHVTGCHVPTAPVVTSLVTLITLYGNELCIFVSSMLSSMSN